MISITNSMAANKKRGLLKWVCFIAYLLLLVYVLFYSALFGRVEHSEYRYNLTMLQEIGRYYYIGIRSGAWKLFIMNVIGNIAVFVPFGVCLPALFPRCRNMLVTTMLTLEFSFCVEIIQLLTKVGSFDVDDLLLNTLGGLVGFIFYAIYRLVKKIGHKK